MKAIFRKNFVTKEYIYNKIFVEDVHKQNQLTVSCDKTMLKY